MCIRDSTSRKLVFVAMPNNIQVGYWMRKLVIDRDFFAQHDEGWTDITRIRHILEGADHVLFVLCLVLGAERLKDLVWRITGFTTGHSITLTAGFFGFVPSAAWFIPAVDTGIALSIIYAAGIAIAVMPGKAAAGRERNMFFVTASIGLLHGLSFSFVLQKILQITSPDIWQSLLAFNVGVEIGQLTIILAAWSVFRLIQRSSSTAWRIGRIGIAMACMTVAVLWTGQRALSVFESL